MGCNNYLLYLLLFTIIFFFELPFQIMSEKTDHAIERKNIAPILLVDITSLNIVSNNKSTIM